MGTGEFPGSSDPKLPAAAEADTFQMAAVAGEIAAENRDMLFDHEGGTASASVANASLPPGVLAKPFLVGQPLAQILATSQPLARWSAGTGLFLQSDLRGQLEDGVTLIGVFPFLWGPSCSPR